MVAVSLKKSFFQAEDGIRDRSPSRGLGDVYKRQMPYYTISWNQTNENVANNYNKYLVTDLLRNKYGYDGVVCTDWLVTGDHKAMDVFIDGKVWGVENLTMAERHYKVLMAGADQFGGNNDMKPIIDALSLIHI